ncbi:nucleoside monophosphate kinase [Patescibacteria group bacterium]|nr:MAG: nucleoside monophosphate kinase [Patescibacteria group bacterium]
MNAPLKILLLGPQGSGKGTQAKLVARELGIPAFSMGQLLRDEIATGSALGKEIDAIIAPGNLVSDQTAARVLRKRLGQSDVKNGYLLDGYPRSKEQAKAFTFDKPTHVVVIEVPKEESLRRLSGRLTCFTCGTVYSMKDGRKPGDACECGGRMDVRKDDTPEAIEKRLRIYEEETEPLIAVYGGQGLVRRIDGVGEVEEIHNRIVKAIDR